MKYAALFRGINVGVKNIVRMAALEMLLTGLGLGKVKTYIQSGNAVFETALDSAALIEKIQPAFEARFGFPGNVAIRSSEEIRGLIERLPFTAAEIAEAEAANPEVAHLYVYFLDTPPKQAQIAAILQDESGGDTLRIAGWNIYLLCRQSVRDSKPAARIPKVFGAATARNWQTILHLDDMLSRL